MDARDPLGRLEFAEELAIIRADVTLLSKRLTYVVTAEGATAAVAARAAGNTNLSWQIAACIGGALAVGKALDVECGPI